MNNFSDILYMLNYQQRETVFLFMKFLLESNATTQKNKKQVLLKTSIWDENDIEPIENARKDMTKWTIGTF